MKKTTALLPILMASLLSSHALTSQAQTIKVCSDENYWYPFTLVDEATKAATGWHIDIIREAAQRLNYDIQFTPLPWARCLKEVEAGDFDAVATASYKDERAEFLFYPASAKEAKSPERVMQVEYVVVTPASISYVFEGDVKTLPQPARVPRGYSVAEDLRKEGVTVDDKAGDDEKNLKKLIRDDQGSLVTIPDAIRKLMAENNFTDQIKIHEKPMTSKSYFLPFSKKTSVSEQDRQALWTSISAVREDAEFMGKVAAKY